MTFLLTAVKFISYPVPKNRLPINSPVRPKQASARYELDFYPHLRNVRTAISKSRAECWHSCGRPLEARENSCGARKKTFRADQIFKRLQDLGRPQSTKRGRP